MKFKNFIGIDVSKSNTDVFIYFEKKHSQFSNNQIGFEKMLKWIHQCTHCSLEDILFAFEHTGLYSLPLSLFLSEKKYSFSIIAGLELKRSLGISRGKADKTDARAIAEYAYEKKGKITLYEMPEKNLQQLKRLLSYRERLVKERAAFKGRIKEFKDFLDIKENKVLLESHQKMISQFNEEVKVVEKELYRLIKEDEKLAKQFELINSIKGIGPQTAMVMIVLTNGFTSFDTWRKFASYAGTAPFKNESGTFRGRTKVSQLANKRIKALLSCCACSAIQYNPEMKLYYQERIAGGKNEMSTLNIVRNKLLSRIFAVVKRETPYVDTHAFAA